MNEFQTPKKMVRSVSTFWKEIQPGELMIDPCICLLLALHYGIIKYLKDFWDWFLPKPNKYGPAISITASALNYFIHNSSQKSLPVIFKCGHHMLPDVCPVLWQYEGVVISKTVSVNRTRLLVVISRQLPSPQPWKLVDKYGYFILWL